MIPWWWLLVSIPVSLIVGGVVAVGGYLLYLGNEWMKSW